MRGSQMKGEHLLQNGNKMLYLKVIAKSVDTFIPLGRLDDQFQSWRNLKNILYLENWPINVEVQNVSEISFVYYHIKVKDWQIQDASKCFFLNMDIE